MIAVTQLKSSWSKPKTIAAEMKLSVRAAEAKKVSKGQVSSSWKRSIAGFSCWET